MNREDLDLEQLDQLALEFWQDDLAKFFPKQKEPTYTEYRMFQAGYQKALEFQEVDKDVQMFLNEHDENVRLHFENVDLKEQNARLREALQRIAMRCPNCDEGDEYATCMCFSEPFADQIARAALEEEK